MNFVAIDFETASGQRHSAVSLALVVVRNDQIVDQFYTLLKPDTPFSARNSQIHGIYEQDVVDAPSFKEIWPTIAPFFTEEKLVVAHNATFDVSVLKACLDYYDLPDAHFQVLDTLKTSRKLMTDLPNHKLNTVSAALDISLKNHHNALADAVACAEILIRQGQLFGLEPLKEAVRYK
ncbi:3'-5' exonuclease [Fructobacillus sp. M1-13]|uniref:3'-5' exonuclease n=1 Tax=Fructobacillus papyriferae TaxID=2713171 RepID=A0ABS5QN08_9LACO|nr:3'-5' exonuclease [Fructobacillus papyriferae]MBS9334464.1 3'-5' exonuclease [Fructobacillus papyriferae]MCD2158453.1 3'-5' exonuclease [Fructobacillus papyriferae]